MTKYELDKKDEDVRLSEEDLRILFFVEEKNKTIFEWSKSRNQGIKGFVPRVGDTIEFLDEDNFSGIIKFEVSKVLFIYPHYSSVEVYLKETKKE